MKPSNEPEEKFQWDMTVVMLILLALAFLALVAMAFWPLHHPGGYER